MPAVVYPPQQSMLECVAAVPPLGVFVLDVNVVLKIKDSQPTGPSQCQTLFQSSDRFFLLDGKNQDSP